MKSSQKPVASALLLIIHLLTLQIDDAVAKRGVSNAGSDSKIILEEVIITGINGNNTRVTASAVAEDPSKIGEEVLAFLSNGQTRRRRSKQTSNFDQNAASSIVDDVTEDDLERLKRVIAKYEPQRITSRKAKRKIVNLQNADARDKIAEPATDLDATYHEVLRNISRQASALTTRNAGATSNPYLTQITKNLKPIYVAEATINSVNNNDTQKSRSDVDFPGAPFSVKNKKKLFKKYLQLNRTVTSPSSKLDEETADELITTPRGYVDGKYNEKTKNGSFEWSSNIHSSATEKPDRRKWNVQESSTQFVPPFTLRLNNSNTYGVFNVSNLNNLNIPSVVKPLRLTSSSSYTFAPRPFSIVQPPTTLPVVANLEATTYKKPSHSPANAGLNHQKIASSANVLPLILPTDLFAPSPARHYVPTKRVRHGNLDGNSATIVATTETSPAAAKIAFADYADAPRLSTTKNPRINAQLNSASLNFYSVTEKPATTVLIPSPASVSYKLEPKIAAYNIPSDDKSNLNANLELSLYNQFANLYNAPKVITQDYQNLKQPLQQPVIISQQVSTVPYATLSPFSPTLPKVQPIVPTKLPLAPYYDSRLLVSQNAGGKELDGDRKETVDSSDQSRADDASNAEEEEEEEEEEEAETTSDDKNRGNYKIQINNDAYKIIHETPSAPQREKNDREEETKEDRHQEERRVYKPDKTDKEEKNDSGGYERYENSKDRTDEDEYVDTKELRNEPNDRYRQYGRDGDSEEKKRDGQRDKYDYDIDFKRFDSRYNDDNEQDKEYSTSYDQRKSTGNGRRKKNRKNREREDDDEDTFGARRFRDREQNEKYKKKRKNVPRKDDEEYSETNPKHVREEHHHVNPQSKDNSSEKVRDHVQGESKEHAHKHKHHHEGDHKFEEGKGAEHEEEHHGHHGEKGDKGYKVWHEHEKAEKGHHDKEHATNEYDEKDGEEKKHDEEGGYHEKHHHGEEGKKTAEFGEKGEHKKGHSTHGEHSVHKKDEYEKKTEFFDEFHEDGETEKHGGHHHEHKSEKGGHEKKGHHDEADEDKKYGEGSKYEKGGHHHEHKGHKVDEGHDHHYDKHENHGKKEGHEHGKKWSYKKGDNGGDHKHDR